MNGHQNRPCRIVDGVSSGNFRIDSLARKIKEASETVKENGLEVVGWIGSVGFGLATIGRIIGVM